MVYRILPDFDGQVARWISDKMGQGDDQLLSEAMMTFAFAEDEKLLGALLFHNYEPQHAIWWTVYTTDKRWCNRRMLRQMFGLAFGLLQCKRINLLIETDNTASLKFVQKLGFQIEGKLRRFSLKDKDCYILGMLKEECRWI